MILWMRLNQYIANATTLSRRAADVATTQGRVIVNGQPAQMGQSVADRDEVILDGQKLTVAPTVTIAFNKPAGLVTSRQGQGSDTIYNVVPAKYQTLQPAGRLDKDSSGLLILTNDGSLANRIIHPSGGKTKVYQVTLNKPLSDADAKQLKQGIELEEGTSRLEILKQAGSELIISMVTGWNRQIRRTFHSIGYQVMNLERTAIGQLQLGDLQPGQSRPLTGEEVAWFK